MNRIRLSDRTMKRSNADFSLTFREKLDIAKLLDQLQIDVIELDGIESKKRDSLLIRSVSSSVKNSVVAVPVELSNESVDLVWNALREAACPRLQVVAPTSTVQMEYLCHKKPEAMLAAIEQTVAYCKTFTENVEFIAEDATRSDEDFLLRAIRRAIGAGATTVTVCDDAGNMLFDEFGAFTEKLKSTLPELDGVCLGISCCNQLAMADACSVAAAQKGAGELKTAACSGNTASLLSVAKILFARTDSVGSSGLRLTELQRTVNRICDICRTERSGGSPFDDGVRGKEAAVLPALTALDDRTRVEEAVRALGYSLSEEDISKVFSSFERIAGKKERVDERELEAIIAAVSMQVPPTYEVAGYVINTGSNISSTAHLSLVRAGRVLEGVSLGDGPIDAAFLAIEQIVGKHYELDDFQIRAVTEGREAMGETVVKLRHEGKLYSGRGISTDIVGAGIRAYINALNKIAYEAEEEEE